MSIWCFKIMMSIRDNLGRFKKGCHWRKPKQYWNKEWLYREYIENKKSASQIAQEQGCKENNILYFLDKFLISTRSVTEIRKYKHWGAKGIDNPMFNKRGESSPNWKGGLTPLRQCFYSSLEWKQVCSEVWKRDKASCQRCGMKHDEGIPMHIHHISSFSNGELRADKNNLILLCDVCHRWIHGKLNIQKIFLGGGG